MIKVSTVMCRMFLIDSRHVGDGSSLWRVGAVTSRCPHLGYSFWALRPQRCGGTPWIQTRCYWYSCSNQLSCITKIAADTSRCACASPRSGMLCDGVMLNRCRRSRQILQEETWIGAGSTPLRRRLTGPGDAWGGTCRRPSAFFRPSQRWSEHPKANAARCA